MALSTPGDHGNNQQCAERSRYRVVRYNRAMSRAGTPPTACPSKWILYSSASFVRSIGLNQILIQLSFFSVSVRSQSPDDLDRATPLQFVPFEFVVEVLNSSRLAFIRGLGLGSFLFMLARIWLPAPRPLRAPIRRLSGGQLIFPSKIRRPATLLFIEYLLRYKNTRDASAASFRSTRERDQFDSALLSPASYSYAVSSTAVRALSSFLRDRRSLLDGMRGWGGILCCRRACDASAWCQRVSACSLASLVALLRPCRVVWKASRASDHRIQRAEALPSPILDVSADGDIACPVTGAWRVVALCAAAAARLPAALGAAMMRLPAAALARSPFLRYPS
ncbi:hypothetical protein THAOC_20668 [Thalassiosira oceanica]|uniref:Uncharacterized protein n=1 Tax=Thalassiosira oceanica TaxID=159749 RepID=K0SL28_THAOC|nr:hypothetical protein THAOC_20668 [Thalassiosira oceanica]|eukprot:EJK59147.1 hypothetical protein THAOC_20668 [Thalassiosira oceanica]